MYALLAFVEYTTVIIQLPQVASLALVESMYYIRCTKCNAHFTAQSLVDLRALRGQCLQSIECLQLIGLLLWVPLRND